MWLFNWKKTSDFEKSKKWTDHIKEFFTLKKDLGDLGDQVVDVNNKFNDYYKKPEIDKIKRELEDLGRDVGSFYNRINDVEEDMNNLKEKVNTIVEFINQLKDKEVVDKQYLTQNYHSKKDFDNYSLVLRIKALAFKPTATSNKTVWIQYYGEDQFTIDMSGNLNNKISGSYNHAIEQKNNGPWKIT